MPETQVPEMQVAAEETMSEPNAIDPRFAPEVLSAAIEALLLVAERPLNDARIFNLLELDVAEKDLDARAAALTGIRATIEQLNDTYIATDRSFRIVSVAGGRQIMTLPQHGELLARLRGERQLQRLTPAALETLAIIAYRQPLLRADLEAIRGVACGEVLRGLLERRLVRITGRAEELGRPMLYGTTAEFLQIFGLANLKDLPREKDL